MRCNNISTTKRAIHPNGSVFCSYLARTELMSSERWKILNWVPMTRRNFPWNSKSLDFLHDFRLFWSHFLKPRDCMSVKRALYTRTRSIAAIRSHHIVLVESFHVSVLILNTYFFATIVAHLIYCCYGKKRVRKVQRILF